MICSFQLRSLAPWARWAPWSCRAPGLSVVGRPGGLKKRSVAKHAKKMLGDGTGVKLMRFFIYDIFYEKVDGRPYVNFFI